MHLCGRNTKRCRALEKPHLGILGKPGFDFGKKVPEMIGHTSVAAMQAD